MNTTDTIYQCEFCRRQFKAEFQGLVRLERPVFCVPTLFTCGQEDCGSVAEENAHREQARKERRAQNRHARHEAKKECRAAKVAQRDAQPESAPSRGLDTSRLPYRDTEPPEVAEIVNHQSPIVNSPGEVIETALTGKLPGANATTAKDFSQHDFEASGAAQSQNEKLIEFFREPHNFNKWFKSKFLEEMSGATRMNNRAIDIRPEFLPSGHYLDNCMIRDTHTDRVCSHYRLCSIENAVSLSEEQKKKLLENLLKS